MAKKKDITGQRFGKLIALEYVGRDKFRKSVWKCQCDCGNVAFANVSQLIRGDITSCGCKKLNGELRRGTGRKARFEPDIENNVLHVYFGKDGYCLCDLDDYDLIKDLSFYYARANAVYCTGAHINGKVYLSRYLLDIDDPSLQVDHINCCKTDNRKSNLRVCTCAENARNKKSAKGYYRVGDYWVAKLKLHGKTVFNRYFRTEEEARRARRDAEKLYFGDFAAQRGDE